MPLLINGQVTQDTWVSLDLAAFEADGAALIDQYKTSQKAVIYPLAIYLEQQSLLSGSDIKAGVLVTGDDDLTQLAQVLEGLSLVAIDFPVLRDGRGFSIARNLVRRGYKGEIRAVGDVGFDRLDNMHRSGFNAYQVADENAAQIFAKAIAEISVNYQPTHLR